jgi:hypothetical protein
VNKFFVFLHLLLVATLGGLIPFHVTLGAHLGGFGAVFGADRLFGRFLGGFALTSGFALAVQFDIVIVLMSHFYYKKDYFFFIFFSLFSPFLK